MIFKLKNNLSIRFPFGKVIFSIILGIAIAIYITQQQAAFKEIIKNYTQPLSEEMLDCSMDFSIDNLNLFRSQFTLKNVSLKPKLNQAQDWSWKCDKLVFKFSWLNFLITNKIDSNITINNIELNSLYHKGDLAINPHLYKLIIEPTDLPIELKSVIINHGTLNVYNKSKKTNFQLQWTSKTKEFRNTLKSSVYLKNGFLKDTHNAYLDQLSGHLQIAAPTNDNSNKIDGICNLNFITPYIDKSDKYFVTARWKKKQGTCKINSINGTVDLSPIIFKIINHKLEIDAKGYLSLTLLQKFAPTKLLQTIDGNGFIETKAIFAKNDYSVTGKCSVENLSLNSKLLVDNVNITFTRNQLFWDGELKLIKEKSIEIDGAWKWRESSKDGHFEFKNKSDITMPIGRGWKIKPQDLEAKFYFKNSPNSLDLKSNYKAVFSNKKISSRKEVSGALTYSKNKIIIGGKIDDDNYQAIFNTAAPYIESFYIKTKDKTNTCSILQKNKTIHSIFDLGLISKWLPEDILNIINGQGRLIVDSELKDNLLTSKISLNKGNLVIPKIYNIIKDLNCNLNLDFNNNTLIVDSAKLSMHKGGIEISQGTIKLSDMYQPEFVYLPVLLNNCAINFEKNLITNLSGKILCQKKPSNKLLLKGMIVLEQTLCKYNLLSKDIQDFFGPSHTPHTIAQINPDLDLNIITRSPIKIHSDFLETNAAIRMRITNNLHDPHTLGHISISGGKINFPYKPLHIIQGSIYFTAEQPNEPMIDLIAKNQIKRFNITMHISGSINNPYIILESSPSLTDEQIGALLLVGSENTTLNMIMPAIIMQNLNNIVFGSMYNEEKTNDLLKSLLKPLDHVKFIPSFSDETGRGGLKGAIEIDVNDRLRALIQKNFSLSEDTKVEIDYSLTDDVSIRGIKDERGDLGGEIEIRWRI
jgi:hypothetical protein